MDDRTKSLLKIADEPIIWDYRVSNSRKSNFDDFWSVTEQKLESLEAAVINDYWHSETIKGDVVVNTTIAISSQDLY